MPPTNCKSTGTCDSRVEQRTAEKVQGSHNWIDPGTQAAFVLEETAPWVVKDDRHDTSLLPRLVCLGLLSFEEESDEPRRTARMEQQSEDMALLWEARKQCASECRAVSPTNGTTRSGALKARPSDEWLKWLASLNDTAISAILTWDGGRHDEDTQRKCPTYGCKCSGERWLSIHMAQWCGADKHRSQTIKRAERATITGNSLGRQSWSAKKQKQIDRTIPCGHVISTS